MYAQLDKMNDIGFFAGRDWPKSLHLLLLDPSDGVFDSADRHMLRVQVEPTLSSA
jgi:hypothetical protein